MQHCITLNANKAVGCGIVRRFSNIDKCRREAAADAISGSFIRPVVLNKSVKLHDTCLNRSREIPPETVVWDGCPYNFRADVDNNVISDEAVYNVDMDVCIKLGYSRSDDVQDIRGADFMSNERTNSTKFEDAFDTA